MLSSKHVGFGIPFLVKNLTRAPCGCTTGVLLILLLIVVLRRMENPWTLLVQSDRLPRSCHRSIYSIFNLTEDGDNLPTCSMHCFSSTDQGAESAGCGYVEFGTLTSTCTPPLLPPPPQDELCLLSPAIAPSFFYVGKLTVDIPLAFNLARPVRVIVSDVLAVVKVGGHRSMSPEVRTCGCRYPRQACVLFHILFYISSSSN